MDGCGKRQRQPRGRLLVASETVASMVTMMGGGGKTQRQPEAWIAEAIVTRTKVATAAATVRNVVDGGGNG